MSSSSSSTPSQETALKILVTAVQVAQSRGAFTLDESSVLAQAISVFIPNKPPTQSPIVAAATSTS